MTDITRKLQDVQDQIQLVDVNWPKEIVRLDLTVEMVECRGLINLNGGHVPEVDQFDLRGNVGLHREHLHSMNSFQIILEGGRDLCLVVLSRDLKRRLHRREIPSVLQCPSGPHPQ